MESRDCPNCEFQSPAGAGQNGTDSEFCTCGHPLAMCVMTESIAASLAGKPLDGPIKIEPATKLGVKSQWPLRFDPKLVEECKLYQPRQAG